MTDTAELFTCIDDQGLDGGERHLVAHVIGLGSAYGTHIPEQSGPAAACWRVAHSPISSPRPSAASKS
jgi:hypothetical protein